jgi:hypothetical protein
MSVHAHPLRCVCVCVCVCVCARARARARVHVRARAHVLSRALVYFCLVEGKGGRRGHIMSGFLLLLLLVKGPHMLHPACTSTSNIHCDLW